MKRVLILGGTGAMGKALVPILQKDYKVTVTSRSYHSLGEVEYLMGNAHDLPFLRQILKNDKYDIVIDFMNYSVQEFQGILDVVLPSTSRYISLSSARVYAPSDEALTEHSPRLLDVCTDSEYLSTQEYALAKAQEENMLMDSSYTNWTIIRPSLTYNDNRMQFALWEKEEWLWRALGGKKILFPEEMSDIKSTMTWGEDVAWTIAKLIDNKRAEGEIFHVAGAKAATWGEIFTVYQNVIKEMVGVEISTFTECTMEDLGHRFNRYWQMKYARGIDRIFDNSKLFDVIGEYQFTSVEDGLRKCMQEFIRSGCKFQGVSWYREANFDRITHDRATWKKNG